MLQFNKSIIFLNNCYYYSIIDDVTKYDGNDVRLYYRRIERHDSSVPSLSQLIPIAIFHYFAFVVSCECLQLRDGNEERGKEFKRVDASISNYSHAGKNHERIPSCRLSRIQSAIPYVL